MTCECGAKAVFRTRKNPRYRGNKEHTMCPACWKEAAASKPRTPSQPKTFHKFQPLRFYLVKAGLEKRK